MPITNSLESLATWRRSKRSNCYTVPAKQEKETHIAYNGVRYTLKPKPYCRSIEEEQQIIGQLSRGEI